MQNRESLLETRAGGGQQMTMLTDFEARASLPSSELIERAEALKEAYASWYEDPLVSRIGKVVTPWYEQTEEQGFYKRAFFIVVASGLALAAVTIKAPKCIEVLQQKRAFKKQLRQESPYLFSNYDSLAYSLTYYADELLVDYQRPALQAGES